MTDQVYQSTIIPDLADTGPIQDLPTHVIDSSNMVGDAKGCGCQTKIYDSNPVISSWYEEFGNDYPNGCELPPRANYSPYDIFALKTKLAPLLYHMNPEYSLHPEVVPYKGAMRVILTVYHGSIPIKLNPKQLQMLVKAYESFVSTLSEHCLLLTTAQIGLKSTTRHYVEETSYNYTKSIIADPGWVRAMLKFITLSPIYHPIQINDGLYVTLNPLSDYEGRYRELYQGVINQLSLWHDREALLMYPTPNYLPLNLLPRHWTETKDLELLSETSIKDMEINLYAPVLAREDIKHKDSNLSWIIDLSLNQLPGVISILTPYLEYLIGKSINSFKHTTMGHKLRLQPLTEILVDAVNEMADDIIENTDPSIVALANPGAETANIADLTEPVDNPNTLLVPLSSSIPVATIPLTNFIGYELLTTDPLIWYAVERLGQHLDLEVCSLYVAASVSQLWAVTPVKLDTVDQQDRLDSLRSKLSAYRYDGITELNVTATEHKTIVERLKQLGVKILGQKKIDDQRQYLFVSSTSTSNGHRSKDSFDLQHVLYRGTSLFSPIYVGNYTADYPEVLRDLTVTTYDSETRLRIKFLSLLAYSRLTEDLKTPNGLNDLEVLPDLRILLPIVRAQTYEAFLKQLQHYFSRLPDIKVEVNKTVQSAPTFNSTATMIIVNIENYTLTLPI